MAKKYLVLQNTYVDRYYTQGEVVTKPDDWEPPKLNEKANGGPKFKLIGSTESVPDAEEGDKEIMKEVAKVAKEKKITPQLLVGIYEAAGATTAAEKLAAVRAFELDGKAKK